MKRFKHLIVAIVALTFLATLAWAGTAAKFKYGIRFKDEGSAHSTPPSGYGELYVNGDALYFIDDSGTATDVIATTSATAWHNLAVPTAHETLNMGSYYTEWTFADTDHDMFTMFFTGAFGDYTGFLLEQKTGNPTNGTIFEIKMADTDPDFLSFATGGVEKVHIADNGDLTLSAGSIVLTAGDLTVGGTTTLTGTMYQAAIAAAASGNTNLTIDAAGTGTITIGGTSTGKVATDNAVELFGNTDIGNAATDTLTITSIIDGDVTLDDGSTDSPKLIFKDSDDEQAEIYQDQSSDDLNVECHDAADSLAVTVGNISVGTPNVSVISLDGDDLYVADDAEIDGTLVVDTDIDVNGTGNISGNLVLGGNVTQTLSAAGYMKIDADSTANTGTAGVLDIDVQSATNTHKGATMTYQLEDGATLAYGWYIDVNDDTSGAEVIELYHAVNSAGTNATTKGFVVANTIDQGFVATNGAAATAIVIDATTTASTSTSGGLMDVAFRTATTAAQAINIDVESDVAGGAGEVVEGIHIQLDDDANSADDVLIGIEIDTDDNGTGLQHAIIVRDSAGWDAGLYLEGGYLRVGTGGSPDQSLSDGDNAYFEGTVEVDGNLYPDGNIIGDGATEIVGVRHDVVVSGGATHAVTATMSGTVFYNDQACEFDLPADPTGLEFTFIVHNATNLDIDPNGTDRFPSPITNANGDYLRSSTIGDSITIVGIDASTWYVKATYPAATDWVEE